MLVYVTEAVLGYLLGSVSFSIILSRRAYKKDVRNEGSGNAGATNVARVFGLKAGLLTLLCDVLKMVLPMLLGMHLSGDIGIAVAGIAGLLGHCFPVYFGFRGGKGVSVAAAIALFADWRVFLVGIAVFAIAFLISRIVSVSSMLAAISLPIAAFAFADTTPRLILLTVTCILVLFMHRSNFARLIKGKEKEFVPKEEKRKK